MMMTLKMKNSNRQIAEQILRLMQRDDSADAAADSVKWAKNLFRTKAAERPASIAEKIMAVLQIDLSPGRAALGERSAGAGQARQMLFDAGDNSIDLRVREGKGGFEIHGQVLGTGFAAGEVELTAGGKSFKAGLGETSEFKLTGLAAGNYVFTARGDQKELVIEGLNLD
jgi:hypothetical protein